jgi:phosphoglycolate phosphatase-like HAD superfamily hydrolase
MYLFDIDGTLLLTGGAGTRAINALFQERYGVFEAMSGVSCAGKTDGLIFQEVAERALGRALERHVIDELIEEYVPRLASEMVDSPKFHLMPRVRECLHYLQGQARQIMGIATGNVAAAAQAKLERAGLADFFSFGGYGCDSTDRKELVAAAVTRGRELVGKAIPAENFVVVGDTVRDIDAARACGVRVVAVATGSVDYDTLAAAAPDATLRSLADLPDWHERHF